MNWACQTSVPAGRAGSGIGHQSALLFARERASVVVVDVDDNVGHETVTMIGGDDGCAKFVHVSVLPSFLYPLAKNLCHGSGILRFENREYLQGVFLVLGSVCWSDFGVIPHGNAHAQSKFFRMAHRCFCFLANNIVAATCYGSLFYLLFPILFRDLRVFWLLR